MAASAFATMSGALGRRRSTAVMCPEISGASRLPLAEISMPRRPEARAASAAGSIDLRSVSRITARISRVLSATLTCPVMSNCALFFRRRACSKVSILLTSLSCAWTLSRAYVLKPGFSPESRTIICGFSRDPVPVTLPEKLPLAARSGARSSSSSRLNSTVRSRACSRPFFPPNARVPRALSVPCLRLRVRS